MASSENSNQQIVNQARDLSRWFQVSIEIRVLGKVIWSYVWPPTKK